MIIGLTGSIATGKSTLSKYLKDLGYLVINTDDIAHQVLTFPHIIKKIESLVNKDVVESGIINRKKLGDIVFNDSEKLRILNNITHPEIYRITKDLIEKQSGVVFVEVPLLFETNFTSLVDKIIVISADEKIQIKRLKKRNKITTNEAINLINKQMSLNEKARLADYVIDNSSTIKHMERQVLNLLEKENLR
ncbi:MAG: dephospho-CoA kinase [Bacilli bacterium]|jgi:dephospho-CoA kinase|nr:dephospho-CoA kinase [Bacilli bacterium]MDD2682402.1 dephospho-CoA kinase [Bacilli bacterium]MDD3121293.1 dephospho-CoA kinase [Bacilli bacterium]MDD4063456.1 dephospho-CoA kinase [Bacilli bacterium]MDD4482117.1 dephospho-CoA kinase [Bacilli bacterium]